MTAQNLATPERQSKLFHSATRMARVAASIVDADELFRWTVNTICTEFGYEAAGIFLLDDTGQWAVLRAGYGNASPAIPLTTHKLAVGGNSIIGLVTRLREPRLVRNAHEEEMSFAPIPSFPQAISEISLPLISADEVLGALSVQSRKADAFTQEDVAVLQSMADQLAIAIRYSRVNRHNHELVRKAERRARLLQASNEVGKRVASILVLEELLPKMVDIICDAYGFYYAGVFLIDDSGQWAALHAGHGEAGDTMVSKGHKLAVGGHSMIGMATSLGEARIALDVGEERVHFKNPLLPYTRSEMALPLIVGDAILGAVTVQSTEECAFSQDDIMSLQTMADHLAVAIHNARLLKELERANMELLRTKTYEALTASTTKTIHWIGNKALPITTAVERMKQDLKSEKFDRASLIEDLDMVAESARLIVDVKENLLGAARESKPRPAMLADVARAAAFYAGVPSDRLVWDVVPNTPLAIADTTQLSRALANLFRNANEAAISKITVSISPAGAGNYVSMAISDNGPGIAPEVMDTMWAAFVTNKGAQHTGLGLPAALHVITQLHGRISASSMPNKGATFTVLLPASVHTEDGQALFPASPKKIILVDDDDDWNLYAREVLSAAGKEVTCCPSLGEKGVLAKADLILVDETLEKVSLAALLEGFKDAGVVDKVVVVSPGLRVDNTTAYLQAGVKDIVLKPYTAAELAALLAK